MVTPLALVSPLARFPLEDLTQVLGMIRVLDLEVVMMWGLRYCHMQGMRQVSQTPVFRNAMRDAIKREL